MFFLAKRFTDNPFYSTLFLISTPAFLVMSHNIMLDIPFLGLYLASIASFINGIDSNSRKLLILSGILGGLAILTKYTGLSLIAFLLIYAFLKKKKKNMLFLIIPILFFCAWCLHNLIFYNELHIISTINNIVSFDIQKIIQHLLGVFIFISGVTLFPLFLLPLLLKNINNSKIYFICFIVTLGIILFIKEMLLSYGIIQKLILLISISISLFIILLFLRQVIFPPDKNNLDRFFLNIWFFGFLFLNVIAHYVAARYILLSVPPMILLLISYLDTIKFKFLNPRVFYLICLSIILAFSVAISIADYRFAALYRNFADDIKKEYGIANNKVWFEGHWGFQYYMMKNGYSFLDPQEDSPMPGDILIKPILADYDNKIYPKWKNALESIDTKIYYGNLKLLNSEAHAGFYSQGWGFLPFFSSESEVERIEIYRFKVPS